MHFQSLSENKNFSMRKVTVRYDEKMVITGIAFAMSLVSKCGCLLARILSDGRTVSICRGWHVF